MGLIKTVCANNVEASLDHDFQTNNGNGRRTVSSQFECPYAYSGGEVRCFYPHRIAQDPPRHAWLPPSPNGIPKDFSSVLCPAYTNLVNNYCPILSLKITDQVEIPGDLLTQSYDELSEKDRKRIIFTEIKQEPEDGNRRSPVSSFDK